MTKVGARHYLSAAQRAGAPRLRLLAGAANLDDHQHRAAPADVAARLLQRRLGTGRADWRPEFVDAGADQTVPGLLGHRVFGRPRAAKAGEVRARRHRGEGGADQGARALVSRFRRSPEVAASNSANFEIKGTRAHYGARAAYGFEVPNELTA